MPSHRRKPKALSTKIEFLKRLEEYHRYVSTSSIHVRVGTPDYQTLSTLGEQLRACYCAISGEKEVPWARDTTTSSAPRPWDDD